MRAYNKSNKVIGIGDLVLLPEEMEKIPAGYENNKILKDYEAQGFIQLIAEDSAEEEKWQPSETDTAEEADTPTAEETDAPGKDKKAGRKKEPDLKEKA